MPRPKVHTVTSPAAWEVLVAPARAEIAEAIRLLGPCSVAEVAEAIGRPADTLYRHIALLTDAGFLRDAGVRKGERNLERLVDTVADDFVIGFEDGSGADENRAIVATANSFLSAMGRAVRDSAAARQLVFTDKDRNISINYELSWLRQEDYHEVRALIRRLKQIMDDGKTRREGRLYMTLAMACPVTRKRSGRTARPEPAVPERSSRSARRPAQDAGTRAGGSKADRTKSPAKRSTPDRGPTKPSHATGSKPRTIKATAANRRAADGRD
jgi:Predicted transcriptional regulator